MDIQRIKKATETGIGVVLISTGADLVAKGDTLIGAILILVGWLVIYFEKRYNWELRR